MSNQLPINCTRCGTAINPNQLAGLCPRCLAAQHFATDTAAPHGSAPGGSAPGGSARRQEPPPSPEKIAASLPQLEAIEFLGRGGMGVVYKARQKSLGRTVALKLLAPERLGDSEFAARFEREAKALAALNHPNIVTIYDFGKAGEFYYLLMEFVDGVNLRQAISAGRFTPEQSLAIVPPVCEALQYAHEHGIVHRDIKPENLLLDKEGRVKIADFGIAKMLGTDELSDDLPESQPAGTPQYMAPEQKEHRVTDHRADIYSLGVVLYEMLTGELPADKLQPPSRKVQVDVRLDEIVLRALDKMPELRFQTAAAFRTQVEAVTNGAGLPSTKAKFATTPTRVSRTAIVGACVAAMGLLSIFLSVFMDRIIGRTDISQVDDLSRQPTSRAAIALLGAALLYAFFATLLGWIAVSQIRRSAGRIYGLWLAVVDGLMFPLMALSAAIALAGVSLAKMFVDFYGNPTVVGSSQLSVVTRMANWLALNNEFAVIVGVMAAIVVDALIVRDVLQAVRKEASSAPVASTPQGNEAQIASISIIFALIATSLGALAAVRSSGTWPAMALSLLFAGLSILMALPVRRSSVGKSALVIATLGAIIWPLAPLVVQLGRPDRVASPFRVDRVVVAEDQAVISQPRYDFEGVTITFGPAENRWTPSGVYLEAMLDINLEPHRYDGGANWVVRTRRGTHFDYQLDGPPGPMQGKVVFHPGTPAPDADGAYVIGEFRPDAGASLPLAVKIENDQVESANNPAAHFPTSAHISHNHLSLMVTHDQSEQALHYVFYYTGDFGTTSSGSQNLATNTWVDEGAVKLQNGRTFGYRREALYPDELHINGADYDLRKGRVLVLHDDGTLDQVKAFPALTVARDPEALAKAITLKPLSPPERIDFQVLRVENPQGTRDILLHFERDANYGLAFEVWQDVTASPDGKAPQEGYRTSQQKTWVGLNSERILAWQLPQEFTEAEVNSLAKEMEKKWKGSHPLPDGAVPEFATALHRDGWKYHLATKVLREPASGGTSNELTTANEERASHLPRKSNEWSNMFLTLTKEVAETRELPAAKPEELVSWGPEKEGMRAGLLIAGRVGYGQRLRTRLVFRNVSNETKELKLTLTKYAIELLTTAEDGTSVGTTTPMLLGSNARIPVTLKSGEQIELEGWTVQFGENKQKSEESACFVETGFGKVMLKFKLQNLPLPDTGASAVIVEPTFHELPENQIKPQEAVKQLPMFGPVVESTLFHAGDTSTDIFFDLDTGRFVQATPDVSLLRKREVISDVAEPIANWAKTNGADLMIDSISPKVTAILFGGYISAQRFTFDNSAADEVLKIAFDASLLREPKGSVLPSITVFNAADGNDDAVVFQSREGGIGLLQILKHTEKPRSVTVRYKMLTQPEQKHAKRTFPLRHKQGDDMLVPPRQILQRLDDHETSPEPLVLIGHSDWIKGLAFSPDGKRLASASRDTTIKLWDVVTGKETLTLKRSADLNDGHTGYVEDVQFSPDGKYLASVGSSEQTIRIWNSESGRNIHTLTSGGGVGASALAFSPDGTQLATAGSTLRVFDMNLDAARSQPVIDVDAGEPFSVAFSPDGARLATVGSDRSLRIWNPLTSEEILHVDHEREFYSVSFSPDGKRLATANMQEIILWDANTGKVALKLQGATEHIHQAFSPDGRWLATAGWNTDVKLWNTETGQEVLTLSGHGNNVWAVAFSPDGKRLATGGADRIVRIWDVDLQAANNTTNNNALSFNVSGHQTLTFPLQHKLARNMQSALLQLLHGRPDCAAKATEDDENIIVFASPEMMSRVRTFITVNDATDTLAREEPHGYPQSTPLVAVRAFLHACAIEDTDEAITSLLSVGVLAELRGDTSKEYEAYQSTGVADPMWEAELRGDWPDKHDALRKLVSEWNRHPLRAIYDSYETTNTPHTSVATVFVDVPVDLSFVDVLASPKASDVEGQADGATHEPKFFVDSFPIWWPHPTSRRAMTAEEKIKRYQSQPDRQDSNQ